MAHISKIFLHQFEWMSEGASDSLTLQNPKPESVRKNEERLLYRCIYKIFKRLYNISLPFAWDFLGDPERTGRITRSCMYVWNGCRTTNKAHMMHILCMCVVYRARYNHIIFLSENYFDWLFVLLTCETLKTCFLWLVYAIIIIIIIVFHFLILFCLWKRQRQKFQHVLCIIIIIFDVAYRSCTFLQMYHLNVLNRQQHSHSRCKRIKHPNVRISSAPWLVLFSPAR